MGEREFLLGLDLYASDFFLGKSLDEVASQTVGLLVEYRSKCPKVCQWLARGDFNPHKVPDTLTSGELLHAARTGQRLRAEALRKSSFSRDLIDGDE
jgi:hypothetical protein